MKKKILIIYEKSKKIGMGHYYRSLRLNQLLKNYYYTEIKQLKKKIKLEYLLRGYDLSILDLKVYPKISKKNKIITFEDIYKSNINHLSINPLDINLANSGPEYFLFPKNIDKINYNFNKKKKINILFLQGGVDSNNQLNKLINYVLIKKKEINFNFNIVSKNFINNKIKNKTNLKILKFNKDVTKLYKNIQIAISSVGNTSFELGRIGIPSIHYTLEKREIKRAKILNKLNLGRYVNKDDMYEIIKELNKIYNNDNYRKKLVENRKKYFKRKNKLLNIIQNEI